MRSQKSSTETLMKKLKEFGDNRGQYNNEKL
jgi:hypothetical protein